MHGTPCIKNMVILIFNELFKSAENYARNGFPIHEVVAKHWNSNTKKLQITSFNKFYFFKKWQTL